MFDLAVLDPSSLLPFILIGFAAQLVDGALGMAFGVICNTLLVAGVPPPLVKISVIRTRSRPPAPGQQP